MPPRDQRSGINRGFTWLRKVLQITEETDAPSVLSDVVRPTMDVFGWERHQEMTALLALGAAAANFTITPVVPDGFMRYISEASIESNDAVTALTLWIEHRTSSGVDQDIAVTRPLLVAAGAFAIHLAMDRPILLASGDRLVGKSEPAPVGAATLRLKTRFIDLPIGEYIAPL